MRLFSNYRRSGFTQPGRAFAATDKQIDVLVYELYDLTDSEIRIIEEAT